MGRRKGTQNHILNGEEDKGKEVALITGKKNWTLLVQAEAMWWFSTGIFREERAVEACVTISIPLA